MTSQGPRIGFCCVNNDPTVIYTTVVKYSDKTCLDFDTQVTLSGVMMKGPDQELVAGIGLEKVVQNGIERHVIVYKRMRVW